MSIHRRPILAVFIPLILIALFAIHPFGRIDRLRPEPIRRPQAATTGGLAGAAAVGVETDGSGGDDDGRTVVSPAGRVRRWGQADELGYVLPLDVRRPKAQKPLGEAQPPEEIRRLRGGAPEPLFEEHRVSPDDGHTQNETAIDTDGDTILAAFHRFGNGTLVLGVARSLDGGQGWEGVEVAGSHTVLTDPCVKSAGGGLWILSYLAMGGVGGSDYEVFARRSTDAGATWSAPVAITNDSGHDDKPYVAASGDYVVAGYADFGSSPARVRAVRSTNGGASFDHDVILANNSGGGNGACPVIDRDGVFHVFWRDSFQDSLWVSHSIDHGVTWSPDRGIVAMNPLPSQLPPGFRMVNLPSAAADPATGAIVVVWNDQLFGDPDILSIRSMDGGITWSDPVRVNDDAGGMAQFFPWIAFDPHGIAHACWYDRRENGSDIDVYFARSTDGGASWEPNVRVTAAPFPPILPWDATTPFIGDYNAIAANATTVFPCFQDAREGNQDVYVSLLPGGPPASVGEGEGIASGRMNRSSLTAAPSLFSADQPVLLRASGDVPAGAVVEIVTAGGRHVRDLVLGTSGTATWDSRDDKGTPLPDGVYFARLRGMPGGTRLVKLR